LWSLQWCYLLKGAFCFSKTPIFEKLILVQVQPLKHGTQTTLGKISVDYSAFNIDSDFILTIDRVKMRRGMIAIEHSDHDPQES